MGILNQPAYIVGFDYFLAQKTCNIWTVIFSRLPSPFFFSSRHVRFALNILKMCCLLYISHEFGQDMRFFSITFLTFHSFSSRFSGCQRFGPVWFGWAPLLFSCLDRNMIFNWLSATRVGKLFPDGWKHPETLCQNSRDRKSTRLNSSHT